MKNVYIDYQILLPDGDSILGGTVSPIKRADIERRVREHTGRDDVEFSLKILGTTKTPPSK